MALRVNSNGNPDNRSAKERFDFRMVQIKGNPDFKVEDMKGTYKITFAGQDEAATVKMNDADAIDQLFMEYITVQRKNGN